MTRYILYFLFLIPSLLEAQLTRRQVYDYQPGDIIQWWYYGWITDSIVFRQISPTNDTASYTISRTIVQSSIGFPTPGIVTLTYPNLDSIAKHYLVPSCLTDSDSTYNSAQYCNMLNWEAFSNPVPSCFEPASWRSFLIAGVGGPYYTYFDPSGPGGETLSLVYFRKDTLTCGTRYRPPAGIHDFLSDRGIKIYPNPSTGYILVEVSEQHLNNSTITFYDFSGKRAYSFQMDDSIKRLVTETWPSGLYFYEVTTEGQRIQTGKLIIN